MKFPKHYEEASVVSAPLKEVFAFANDHTKLASHMNKSSMMMGGGKMETIVDEGKGQKLGSHIEMKGSVLGLNLYIDEVITEYKPPFRKVWETVGRPKLVIIGNYQLGFELSEAGDKSMFKVFINYDLPTGGSRFLGLVFGKMYAKWCVRQMIDSVARAF